MSAVSPVNGGETATGRVWLDLDGEVCIRWQVDETLGDNTQQIKIDHPHLGAVTFLGDVRRSGMGNTEGSVPHASIGRSDAPIERIQRQSLNIGSITGYEL
jgi:hypothetical protein